MSNSSEFVWEKQAGLDGCLAYISNRIASALGHRDKEIAHLAYKDFLELESKTPSKICVVLPRSLAFSDTFETRSASYGNLKKILENEQPRLSPTENEETFILTQHEGPIINLLHIRRSTLDEIEEKSKELGATDIYVSAIDNEYQKFLTPSPLSQSVRERRLTLIAWLAMITSIWILLTAIGSKQSSFLNQLKSQETYLRSSLMERTDAERKTEILEDIAKQHPEHLTASARLYQLSNLTRATPTSAWWTQISFDTQKANIIGISPNAADTLSTISTKLTDAKVTFSKNISDSEKGQNFNITVERKETR